MKANRLTVVQYDIGKQYEAAAAFVVVRPGADQQHHVIHREALSIEPAADLRWSGEGFEIFVCQCRPATRERVPEELILGV